MTTAVFQHETQEVEQREELAERTHDGMQVTLLWSRSTN